MAEIGKKLPVVEEVSAEDLRDAEDEMPVRNLYVTEMARRLAALIAMQTPLDANYRDMIRKTYPWTNP